MGSQLSSRHPEQHHTSPSHHHQRGSVATMYPGRSPGRGKRPSGTDDWRCHLADRCGTVVFERPISCYWHNPNPDALAGPNYGYRPLCAHGHCRVLAIRRQRRSLVGDRDCSRHSRGVVSLMGRNNSQVSSSRQERLTSNIPAPLPNPTCEKQRLIEWQLPNRTGTHGFTAVGFSKQNSNI